MDEEGDTTLTRREQERARILVDLEGDRLTPEEAAYRWIASQPLPTGMSNGDSDD